MNHTNLWRCKLENSTVEGADFSEANLKEAVLTGSHFEQVNLKRAKLRGAGLAEINWSNCDLTGVDFANCSFHLGSTRCGHVDSPYPSHGTRTGFYTEDFDSHQFQSPEEVRKAAMCGCRLFGADVWRADFYLVDLRGAQFENKKSTFGVAKRFWMIGTEASNANLPNLKLQPAYQRHIVLTLTQDSATIGHLGLSTGNLNF